MLYVGGPLDGDAQPSGERSKKVRDFDDYGGHSDVVYLPLTITAADGAVTRVMRPERQGGAETLKLLLESYWREQRG